VVGGGADVLIVRLVTQIEEVPKKVKEVL